jgi:hypothetical protein
MMVISAYCPRWECIHVKACTHTCWPAVKAQPSKQTGTGTQASQLWTLSDLKDKLKLEMEIVQAQPQTG